MTGYNLKQVTVEGFRGINSPVELDLDSAATLILGENGMGKSSLLGAVEWCLFGDLAFTSYLESRGKKDELVNVFNSGKSCRVQVVMEGKDGSLHVEREKRLGTAKTEFTLRLDGTEFHGDEAQEALRDRLNVTFEDFYRAVYLHQQSIRGLLTDKPADRDEAMDRLFGLELLRNVVGALPIRVLENQVREYARQKERLEHEVYGARRQIEADYQVSLKEAQKAGVDASAITTHLASALLGEVITGLTEIAAKYELEPPTFIVPETPQEMARVLERSRDYLRSSRRAQLLGGDVDHMVATISTLKRIESSLTGTLAKIQGLGEATSKVRSQIGDEETINVRLGEIERGQVQNRERADEARASEAKLTTERNRVSAHVRVAEDGLEFLRDQETDRCPVCDQEIDRHGVISHLEEVLGNLESDALRSIDERISELRETSTQLDGVDAELRESKEELLASQKDLLQLEEDINEAKDRLTSHLGDLEELAGSPVSEAQAFDVISSLLEEYEKKQGQLDTLLESRERTIQAIEESVEKVGVTLEVLGMKEKFDQLEVMYKDERAEMEQLEKSMGSLDRLVERLVEIEQAAVAVQESLAKEAVEDSSDLIDEFYGLLCNHPYYSQLRIEVRPRKAAGRIKNSYEIRAVNATDGKSTLAATRLSTGQMNCVALSVYLALARAQSHNLNFLLLDDPSQSLDAPHKAALVGLLNKVAGGKNVIVSTQDEELSDLLLKKVTPAGGRLVYRLSSWSENGPSIAKL